MVVISEQHCFFYIKLMSKIQCLPNVVNVRNSEVSLLSPWIFLAITVTLYSVSAFRESNTHVISMSPASSAWSCTRSISDKLIKKYVHFISDNRVNHLVILIFLAFSTFLKVANGFLQFQIVSHGCKQFLMVANSFLWLQLVSYGCKTFLMVAKRFLWLQIVS